MTILLYEGNELEAKDQDEIKILLLIESVKKIELKGKKGETIKDIIKNYSIFKIDLKWCIFKYKENEIDLNKKFDNIANDEDKTKSELIITVNYTIPVIVNCFKENKKK